MRCSVLVGRVMLPRLLDGPTVVVGGDRPPKVADKSVSSTPAPYVQYASSPLWSIFARLVMPYKQACFVSELVTRRRRPRRRTGQRPRRFRRRWASGSRSPVTCSDAVVDTGKVPWDTGGAAVVLAAVRGCSMARERRIVRSDEQAFSARGRLHLDYKRDRTGRLPKLNQSRDADPEGPRPTPARSSRASRPPRLLRARGRPAAACTASRPCCRRCFRSVVPCSRAPCAFAADFSRPLTARATGSEALLFGLLGSRPVSYEHFS